MPSLTATRWLYWSPRRQPSESILGISRKCILKGSGLWLFSLWPSLRVGLSHSERKRFWDFGWASLAEALLHTWSLLSTAGLYRCVPWPLVITQKHALLLPQHLHCLRPLQLLALPGVHPDPVGRLQGQPGHGHPVVGSHKVLLPVVVVDRRDDTPDHLVHS